MCGISGYLPRHPVPEECLKSKIEAMTSALAHRGPDHHAVMVSSPIALGHRRLSILDKTAAGNQPMSSRCGRYIMVYNGEIYNFRELRQRLEKLGKIFRSTGDSEVLIEAYAEWGPDILRNLNGMFALAIWDSQHHELLIARDQFGIKPLFYAQTSNCFAFGSEVTSLLALREVEIGLDFQAIDQFFTFNYVGAPATGFEAIRQLEAGHYAIVDSTGLRRLVRYFDVSNLLDSAPPRISESETLDLFRKYLDVAVKRQMISDVPVFAFLSGGLDSTAIADSCRRTAGSDVDTISVRFSDAGYDESTAAANSARHLGLRHQVVEAENLSIDDLIACSRHSMEPTADASALPVFLLCKAARKLGKVALSGDGADELLAGYPTYFATDLANHIGAITPKLVSKTVLRGLDFLPPMKTGRYGVHEFGRRFFSYLGEPFPQNHARWRTIFSPAIKSRIYSQTFANRVGRSNPYEGYENQNAFENTSELVRSQLMDLRFYLPNDMLTKVDRMSMAHGLEVRVPFLDLELARFCVNLPRKFKLSASGSGKVILRKHLSQTFGRSIVHGKKKGFNFPIESYLRSKWRELFYDLLERHRRSYDDILNVDQVTQLYQEFLTGNSTLRYPLFGILSFLLWQDNVRSLSRN